ncbi:unnamed protein product [Chondrus crispus]|uniref:Nuclear pore complex protein NUP96 C-terminal domain-containing protein n=1 Tax=Chondrus crispus TaxID=2769 RepID=R7Q7U8_CHOCR|nr:unnamed protein product [Chondrus crispus]CDF33451.1 unnamed protein product [Chondrus crispus]|eukprot:XP_005713254.1 unnamed protein product [Chondrus crispus]
MLRVHCGTWFGSISVQEAEASDQEGGLKMPSLKDGFEFAEVADTTIAQFVEELKFCHDERGDVNALHAHVALSMLLALYKQDNDPVYVGGNTLLRRIAEWADGPAGVAFDEEGNCKAVGLRSAVLNLSLGKIEEAVAAAAEAGHLRLSLLIARALEAPKEGLREDALAQLDAYGLLHEQEESNRSSAEDSTSDAGIDWDAILKDCPYDAEVTVDERMILLMLTGQVGCVASFLGLSWYRLFIMEFFHGAGSSDLTQAERVSAAVNAIDEERISTLAPHGYGQAIDVVYHLLRLYADPTASYPLTAGVYENESVGAIYSPLDARFSWLIYQVLTAVIPQASTPNAPQMLADEFSSQLRAAGLHLWSFYVLCSGGAPAHVMRSVLMRDWPNMLNDVVEWTPAGEADSAGGMRDDEHGERGMDSNLEELAGKLDAETFLEDVLGVPKPWIAEAKAIAAHVEEDLFTECKHWTACGTENGATRAHELLSKHVFPEMIACKDGSQLEEVASVLRQLEGFKHVANWSISGGLILNYLEDTVEKRGKKRQPLSVYRAMVDRVCAYAARASTPEQVYAGSVMADEIATAERAVLFDAKGEEREEMVEFLVEDLERLPCSKSVKVRITGEYKTEMKRGQAVARRFSTAHVPYSRFVQ